MNERTPYEEIQSRTYWWVYIVVFLPWPIFIYGAVQQLYFGIPFGNKPAPDLLLIVFNLFFLLFLILLLITKLRTRIDEEGVRLRFLPYQPNGFHYSWDQIEAAEVVHYNPIMEFGGWGLRWNSKGKAYSMRGRYAIRLQLKSGKYRYIGTQRKEEAATAISNWMPASIPINASD